MYILSHSKLGVHYYAQVANMVTKCDNCGFHILIRNFWNRVVFWTNHHYFSFIIQFWHTCCIPSTNIINGHLHSGHCLFCWHAKWSSTDSRQYTSRICINLQFDIKITYKCPNDWISGFSGLFLWMITSGTLLMSWSVPWGILSGRLLFWPSGRRAKPHCNIHIVCIISVTQLYYL